MQKKFRDPGPEEDAAPGGPEAVSLPEYLRRRAPGVLEPLPIMAGVPALQFWQAVFQPPQPEEGRHMRNGAVCWPYADRLIYLAREFTKLDGRSRRYVLRAAGAGVWWRGDRIRHFRVIVRAHIAYRRLSAAQQAEYRKRLLAAAGSAFRRP